MRGLVFGMALLAGCTPLSEIAHRFGIPAERGERCVQKGGSEYWGSYLEFRIKYPVAYACPPKLRIRDEYSTVTKQRADGFTAKSSFYNPSGSFRSVLEWEAVGQLPKGVEPPRAHFHPVSSYASNWKSLDAG